MPILKSDKAAPAHVPSEHMEQAEFVSWFRKSFAGVRIFAIPNGGHRGQREATRLKVEGVSAGVPDLYIPEWRLWVEMKRTKGSSTSKEQKDWHAYLISIGDSVVIPKGCEQAIAMVETFRRTVNTSPP